jgi:ankyrin repeat protein
MLQCLVVAVRPLYVEELAELLAFEFDAAQGGIPKYRAALRLDDQTQAVLSTCSSLVTIVDVARNNRQVVHFSHFSVKEFLMSNRLGDFSRYHIHPIPAHTILTQACLGCLLHLEDHIDEEGLEKFPLATYAAQHWVYHAQFKQVASHVKGGIGALFDPDKHHFATWIWIYDIDQVKFFERSHSASDLSLSSTPNPLYYSTLCGLYDLVEHLTFKHPEYVNAICGLYTFPLLAALGEDHIEVAKLLLERGANIDARETTGMTILLKALSQPHPNLADIVKFLLKHGADVNAQDDTLRSPLHLAEYSGELEVAQMLVEHGADVNFGDDDGQTPLHILLDSRINDEGDVLNHALLLLKHGAEVNRRDNKKQTSLLLAIGGDLFKLAGILLEHGADANAENTNGNTPLHILLKRQIYDKTDLVVALNNRRLRQRDTEVNIRSMENENPLPLEIGTVVYNFVIY